MGCRLVEMLQFLKKTLFYLHQLVLHQIDFHMRLNKPMHLYSYPFKNMKLILYYHHLQLLLEFHYQLIYRICPISIQNHSIQFQLYQQCLLQLLCLDLVSPFYFQMHGSTIHLMQHIMLYIQLQFYLFLPFRLKQSQLHLFYILHLHQYCLLKL